MTKYLLIGLVVLLALSVATNVYFIMGKGIQITNITNTHQYQNQQQAQLLVGAFGNKGTISWTEVCQRDWSTMGITSWAGYLNSIAPERALYAKPMYNSGCMEVPELK